MRLFDHAAKGGGDSGPSPWMRHGPLPPSVTLPRIATIVHYAVTYFYHFVLEAVPRLALLMPRLAADPTIRLAVPTTKAKLRARSGYVAQLLHLLLPDDFYASRLLPYESEGDGKAAPGERAVATAALSWADWPSAASPDGTDSHCLTPSSALRQAAAMVASAWQARQARGSEAEGVEKAAEGGVEGAEVPGGVLLFAARRKVTQRNLASRDEEALLAALREVAEAAGMQLVVFDGSGGVEASIALWKRARLIVGVHGGALSNLLWSAALNVPSSVLLVELTVASRIAHHFAHSAMALGMRYEAVPLVDNGLGVGTVNATLAPGSIDTVGRLARAHLQLPSSRTRDEL